MRKVGLIGFGMIGQSISRIFHERLGWGACISAVLVRPRRKADVEALVGPKVLVTSDLDQFLARSLDVVVEAAAHSAVADFAEQILTTGLELHVLSVGALADDTLRGRLQGAARKCGGRILLPAGALAGFDGLASLREEGLREVRYTVVKPTQAWRDTPAESCLDRQSGRQTLFTGSARQAALAFPRNANLAAAVALAGMGFDETEVELIADHAAVRNSATIDAKSESSRLRVELSSSGFESNPRTSKITAMSVIAALNNRYREIAFA